jgi:hypothetical protein
MRMYVLFGTGWQDHPGIDRQLGRGPSGVLSLLLTGGRERHRARLAIRSSRATPHEASGPRGRKSRRCRARLKEHTWKACEAELRGRPTVRQNPDGCGPPQPALFGPRGRRYLATSCCVWPHSAFPPGRLQRDLQLVALRFEHDRVDECSNGVCRALTALFVGSASEPVSGRGNGAPEFRFPHPVPFLSSPDIGNQGGRRRPCGSPAIATFSTSTSSRANSPSQLKP